MAIQSKKSKNKGCGCSFPLLLLLLGGAYGWFVHLGNPLPKAREVAQLWEENVAVPLLGWDSKEAQSTEVDPVRVSKMSPSQPQNQSGVETATLSKETEVKRPISKPVLSKKSSETAALLGALWEKKEIRGIYISRYQITNNASESTIRERVRYYKRQGFNTILHGVWGNGCTMYRSQVMQQQLGMPSCPNLFQDQWLDWMIDEAHQQGMEVHAYFEKGIKLDKNSPIYDRAVREKWLVPGVDKTYVHVDHYVLDVKVPAVKKLFTAIATEFVQKYPKIDAVQWDDYVGYHAELPVKVNQTQHLTAFMTDMIKSVKAVNSDVSFDVCHHNPYWAKRYFAADWENWGVDRAFIQVYNDGNFEAEMGYVHQYDGAAITSDQLHRLQPLMSDENVKGILVFSNSGNPEETASQVNQAIAKVSSQ